MRFPTLLKSFELEVFFCFLHCLLPAGPPSVCICFYFSHWKLPHSLVMLSLTFIFKNEVACKSQLEGCKVDGTYWLVAFIIEWTGRDHLLASSFTSLRSLCIRRVEAHWILNHFSAEVTPGTSDNCPPPPLVDTYMWGLEYTHQGRKQYSPSLFSIPFIALRELSEENF